MALSRRSKIILSSVVVMGGLGSLIAVSPTVIITPLVEKKIQANGFPKAQVSGLALTPNGLIIDHISLDGDDFSTVDNVSVDFNWGDFIYHRQLERVSVKNISLAADLDDEGHYKISGWDASLPSSDNSSTLLPVPEIVLQGVTLDVATSQGDIRIQGKAAVNTPDPQQQVVQYNVWAQQKQLSFNVSGKANLTAAGGISGNITLDDARLDIAPYEISRTSGYIDFSRASPNASWVTRGHVVAGRVNAYETLLQNIDLTFDSTKDEALKFKSSPSGHADITLSGWLTKPAHRVVANISGQKLNEALALLPTPLSSDITDWTTKIVPYDITAEASFADLMAATKKITVDAKLGNVPVSADIEIDAAAKSFQAKLQANNIKASSLADILPLQEEQQLDLTRGALSVTANIKSGYDDKADHPLKGEALLSLKSVDGTWKDLHLTSVTGDIRLKDIVAPAFDGTQSLTFGIASKDGTTQLGTGTIKFSGAVKDGLSIDLFKANISGGTLSMSPFILPVADKKAKSDLALEHVDIGPLIDFADVDGLTGSGTISGKIPLTFSKNKISIGAATINNDSDGTFAFAPESYPKSLSGDDARMQTVREALKDFHYSKLSLDIDGPLDGKMTSNFQAEGTNPVFGERPIHLNLNLEGDIGPVLQKLVGGPLLSAGEIGDTIRSSSKTSPEKK